MSYIKINQFFLLYIFLTDRPDKLLYTVGERGFLKEQFQFPRSITTCDNGDIVIADSGNHRIQRYNQCAVFIGCFGEKGAGPGQFREPSGVALMTNGSIVVADRKNKRVQVLTDEGEFIYEIKTVHEPFYVCCDALNNIIVSTTTGYIEIYRRSASLQQRFQIPGLTRKGQKTIMAACPMAINNKDEVIISHGINRSIQYYSYAGQLLYEFEAVSTQQGLACQAAGMCVNTAGQVIVADSLNHVIQLYSERGSLLEVLAGPMDSTGSVQSVAIGAEGHLLVSEYSVSGTHCVKIFRYRECECHRTRPGSAKKSTSATTK